METTSKKVTELKPGDAVKHMFGIKRVVCIYPTIDKNHTYICFSDSTWDQIENFRSVEVIYQKEGDTIHTLKFQYSMELHRATTLSMAGFPNETILEKHLVDLLDAYESAYQAMYIERWGKTGPHGHVLRMETEEETKTREAWENAAIDYWKHVDSQEFNGGIMILDTLDNQVE